MVAAASVVKLSSDEVTSGTNSVEVTTVAVGAVAGALSSAVATSALESFSSSVDVTSGAKPEEEVTGPSSASLSDSVLGGGGGDLKKQEQAFATLL
jgi:hypothetical protein